MGREVTPEIAFVGSSVEKDRWVVEYRVDKLPRHFDQLRESLKDSSDWTGSRLSAVKFSLFYPVNQRLLAMPFLWITGDGMNEPELYVQGMYRGSSEPREIDLPERGTGAWHLLRNQRPGWITTLEELDSRPDKLVGIPTIPISPFMGGSDFQPGMLRKYNVLINSGSDYIQVEADMNPVSSQERLHIRYVSDPRDNYTRDIATLAPGHHGWSITPRGRMYPTDRSKAA